MQINNEHYARRQRLKPLSETIRKLIEAGWEAEIILGEDATKYIQPFEKCFNDLTSAILIFFDQEKLFMSQPSLAEAMQARHTELRDKIYAIESHDPLGSEVDTATLAMKRYIQQFIK